MVSADQAPVFDEAAIRQQALLTPPAPHVTGARRDELISRIKQLLKDRNAVLVAHYYVDEDLQLLADETGRHRGGRRSTVYGRNRQDS